MLFRAKLVKNIRKGILSMLKKTFFLRDVLYMAPSLQNKRETSLEKVSLFVYLLSSFGLADSWVIGTVDGMVSCTGSASVSFWGCALGVLGCFALGCFAFAGCCAVWAFSAGFSCFVGSALGSVLGVSFLGRFLAGCFLAAGCAFCSAGCCSFGCS